MRKTILILAGVIAGVSANAAGWSDAIEGLTAGPLPTGAWSNQSGTPITNGTVDNASFSPRYSSTQSLKMLGNGASQRMWENLGTTINSGKYVYALDFKLYGTPTASYLMRTRPQDPGDYNGKFPTITGMYGYVNSTTLEPHFSPIISEFTPGSTTFTIYYYPNFLSMTAGKWYREEYVLDFDNGTVTGPSIVDLSTGTNVYTLIATSSYGFNADLLLGQFKDFGALALGVDAGATATDGWNVDNINVQPAGTVKGKLNLDSGWIGSAAGLTLDAFVGFGGYANFASVNPATGDFTMTVPAGTTDLYITLSHWLVKKVSSVTVAANTTTDLGTINLLNGDIDGDNAVSVYDYNALSAAFDSVSGDTNWNANADLDGDGSVSVYDYNILSANFDLAGD